MAEWLRRWTADLLQALRAESIPGTVDFFSNFLYDDDGGATRSGASEHEARS